MDSGRIRNSSVYVAAGLLASATLAWGAPLSVPPGGATANIGGCILVNSGGLSFSDTPCTTPQVFNAGAPNTGSYTGLTGGTIQNLTGPPVVGNLPSPIVNFATFNTAAGIVHFDLVSTDPGFGTAAGCITNTPGSNCTLPGSPITLTQITANRVSISLSVNGRAYLDSPATGTSPTGALFTTQNLIPGTITGILAQVTSAAGFQNSYSATFASVSAPGTCPPNTLETLFGTWTFATDGFVTPTQPFASAGTFTASAGVNPVGNTIIGALTITNSASRNRQITRQETDTGTFQVFPDCSGGTLVFNLSANPMQFDFFFANGRREIVFTSITAGTTINGHAWLSPPAACPANPLQSLTGMWTFSVSGLVPEIQHFAATGQFTAGTDSAGNPAALVTILDTASIDGQLTRQSPDSGRYQISPDCSGGSLRLNLAARPMSFDFWFFNGGAEMVLIGTDNGATVFGRARRS